MRPSLLSILALVLGLLAPFFLGPTEHVLGCLWSLRAWTLGALLLAFLVLRQAGRILLRLGMRHPGGRLRAGEGP